MMKKRLKKIKNSKKMTLLCVDDDPMILLPLCAMLKKQYKVLTATGGHEALELLKTQTVDIIISDQRMPEMTGTEFLKVVKQQFPNTIRILLTGYAELGAVVASVNTGEIYRFVEKPWKNDDLVNIVNNASDILKRKNSIDELSPDNSIINIVVQNINDLQICIIDEQKSAYQSITKHFTKNKIHYYSDLSTSLQCLQQNNQISVIIISLDMGKDATLYLLNQLRKINSLIVPIILTEQQDTNQIIQLINYARIFRYLIRPINDEALLRDVKLALEHYKQLQIDPTLNLYNTVELLDTSDIVLEAETNHSLFTAIKKIKGRVFNLFGIGKKPNI